MYFNEYNNEYYTLLYRCEIFKCLYTLTHDYMPFFTLAHMPSFHERNVIIACFVAYNRDDYEDDIYVYEDDIIYVVTNCYLGSYTTGMRYYNIYDTWKELKIWAWDSITEIRRLRNLSEPILTGDVNNRHSTNGCVFVRK